MVRQAAVFSRPAFRHPAAVGNAEAYGGIQGRPVRTCLSGPAAGVVGASVLGREIGMENLITFDVGGTSTDVSLIDRGEPAFTSTRLVADHPVRTPMVDVQVIGAGGGSIAWIDDAGALKVGPKSAGSDPGPVAYGRGGEDVTLTDANIVLRRLNPDALLKGRMPVDAAAARAAIEEKIARPLGLSVEEAAMGIIRITVANMSRAIRSAALPIRAMSCRTRSPSPARASCSSIPRKPLIVTRGDFRSCDTV